MPFVTEAAWQVLKAQAKGEQKQPWSSIMVAEYPRAAEKALDAQAETDFGLLQALVTGIRNIRNEYKVAPGRWIAATIVAGPQTQLLAQQTRLLCRLARLEAANLTLAETVATKPLQVATLVVGTVEVFLPLADLVDLAAEQVRLQQELAAAQADVARREARLSNAEFITKAPGAVVQKERDQLVKAQATLARLQERLASL